MRPKDLIQDDLDQAKKVVGLLEQELEQRKIIWRSAIGNYDSRTHGILNICAEKQSATVPMVKLNGRETFHMNVPDCGGIYTRHPHLHIWIAGGWKCTNLAYDHGLVFCTCASTLKVTKR